MSAPRPEDGNEVLVDAEEPTGAYLRTDLDEASQELITKLIKTGFESELAVELTVGNATFSLIDRIFQSRTV